jgi:acyl carrier protein
MWQREAAIQFLQGSWIPQSPDDTKMCRPKNDFWPLADTAMTLHASDIQATIERYLSRGTNRADILAIVRMSVADVGNMPPEGVALGHSLILDLGLESIDFIELMLRLEVAFGVVVAPPEFKRLICSGVEDRFENAGCLSPHELERLDVLIPEARRRFGTSLNVDEIPTLLTPMSLIRFVAWQLSGGSVADQ